MRLARRLVKTRLAACVQVSGPVASVYRWKGKVEAAEEWRCLAKVRESAFPAVARSIASRHSYEVPEIVALPLTGASESYAAWLDEVTTREV